MMQLEVKGAVQRMPAAKKKRAVPATLSIELELTKLSRDGKEVLEVPREFRIFKAGHNDTEKGVFKFTESSSQRVMDHAKKYRNDFSIDYGHAMFAFFAVDPAESHKAAGWFNPEVRDGELWAANVSWTPKAEEKLLAREFRYISPAFDHSEAGEIHTLRNVALTNIPATHDLTPLMAAWDLGSESPEEPEMNWKQLLAMLSLGEGATEAEAMAALSKMNGPLTELLSATGKKTSVEAMEVVKAWKTAAESVPTMHAELSQLKQTAQDTERQTLLDAGKREGKVPPALEPFLKTQSMEQLKAFLAAAPVLAPGGGKPPAREPNVGTHVTVALTDANLAVAKQMGLSQEEMAKRLHARSGVVPVEVPAEK